jgi:hypothetical protein
MSMQEKLDAAINDQIAALLAELTSHQVKKTVTGDIKGLSKGVHACWQNTTRGQYSAPDRCAALAVGTVSVRVLGEGDLEVSGRTCLLAGGAGQLT